MDSQFLKGLAHGLPIALGYLTVSFGFGISAVRSGLTVGQAAAISASNLTSAGQAAGVAVIAHGGSLWEIALTQLIINMRYALMSLALSQKLCEGFTLPHRLAAGFGITDEIFAVASSRPKPVTPAYMYGLILISFAGWVTGTVMGAMAGNILPARFTDAMGIMLYGMFIAIFIPAARQERGALAAVVIAAGISLAIHFFFPYISEGFSVIISGLTAAAACALIFPSPEEETAK